MIELSDKAGSIGTALQLFRIRTIDGAILEAGAGSRSKFDLKPAQGEILFIYK